MFRFLINVIRFKLAQRAARRYARSIGLRWFAKPIGFIAGLRATR